MMTPRSEAQAYQFTRRELKKIRSNYQAVSEFLTRLLGGPDNIPYTNAKDRIEYLRRSIGDITVLLEETKYDPNT